MFETNGLKGMYFQTVETQALSTLLSTLGQPGVFNLHLAYLDAAVALYGGKFWPHLSLPHSGCLVEELLRGVTGDALKMRRAVGVQAQKQGC